MAIKYVILLLIAISFIVALVVYIKMDKRIEKINQKLYNQELQLTSTVKEKESIKSNLKQYIDKEKKNQETIKILNDTLAQLQKRSHELDSILFLYPELNDLFLDTASDKEFEIGPKSIRQTVIDVNDVLKIMNDDIGAKIMYEQKKQLRFYELTHSNLKIIPYMAEIIADWETYKLERYAQQLDWGSSVAREKKVKSIRDIRAEAETIVQRNKEAQYQLSYLLELFPSLEEIIETDYKDKKTTNEEDYLYYDRVRDYITSEEWNSMSSTDRNQLALDRYINSHKKTKWQIGRDYELFIGYVYSQKGYSVDYFGSYMGIEDLGRDIIAKKNGKIYIVQCKYWSSVKMIHEKHISQLYGTTITYCIENNETPNNVEGVLVTNITLSETAKKFANYLNIKYVENIEVGEYPRIKCNIGQNEYGETVKIYHLPMDQQYDRVKISKNGEFYALTVKEAEEKGFRRALKHYA